jgi:hypothetical protein
MFLIERQPCYPAISTAFTHLLSYLHQIFPNTEIANYVNGTPQALFSCWPASAAYFIGKILI